MLLLPRGTFSIPLFRRDQVDVRPVNSEPSGYSKEVWRQERRRSFVRRSFAQSFSSIEDIKNLDPDPEGHDSPRCNIYEKGEKQPHPRPSQRPNQQPT